MRLMNKLSWQIIIAIGFSWLPCMASLCDQDDLHFESLQSKQYRQIDGKNIVSQHLHNCFNSSDLIRQSLSNSNGAAILLHDLNYFADEDWPQVFAFINKVYNELNVHDFYTDYNYALIQIRGQNIDRAEHAYKYLITYDNLTRNQISKCHDLEIVINFLQGNYDKVANLIKESKAIYARSKVNIMPIVKMALQYLNMKEINPWQQFNIGSNKSIKVDSLEPSRRSLVVEFNNGSIISFKIGSYINFINDNPEFFYIKNLFETAKEFFANPNLWKSKKNIKSLMADNSNLTNVCEQYMHYSSDENERMQAQTILRVLALSDNPQAMTVYLNFLKNNRPRVHTPQDR